MKQPKKLTREQNAMLSKQGIDPKQYAIVQELPNSLILIYKVTGNILVAEK